METSLFDLIGETGFDRLTRAFYAQVPDDDILGPMYPPEELDAARERLRDFLVGRFGGPQRYIEERGHPRLRMRHLRFPIDVRARNRWVELMAIALEQTGLPPSAEALLKRFFADTATFMINR